MHPLFDCSVPHPYKIGQRMRPRNAVRLLVPGEVPGLYAWVSPAFFAYANATPDWYAKEVLPKWDVVRAMLLDDDDREAAQAELSSARLAAKGGSHE
jgi:hypothetical protein